MLAGTYPGININFRFWSQVNGPAVAPQHQIQSFGPGLATFDPVRTEYPPLRHDCEGDRTPEEQLPDDAVAAVEGPRTAGLLPQPELPDYDRVPPLQNLRVRDPGVGHMRVNAGPTVPSRSLE